MDTSTQQQPLDLAKLKKIVSNLSESIGCIEPNSLEDPGALANAHQHLEALETEIKRAPMNRLTKREIDQDMVENHLREIYTIGELLSCYKPESSPHTAFGNIYSNVGFMIQDHAFAIFGGMFTAAEPMIDD